MKPVLYTWGYSADGEEFALWTLLPRSNGVMREAEIILLCVRWSLRYALSYRDLEEMMLERGSACRSHHDVPASVQQYAPELEKRSRPHLKATNDSWRVDETSIKIKTTWTSLYRAVDSEGNTLEFLFSPTRDAEAAKRIFLKALQLPTGSVSPASAIDQKAAQSFMTDTPKASKPAPRVINVEKNAAYPKAIADLKAMGVLPESVELTSGSSISTTCSNKIIARIKRLRHPRDGLLLVGDGVANETVIRGDEHDQERTTAKREKRRCERPGRAGCQAVWSGSLTQRGEPLHVHLAFVIVFATQPVLWYKSEMKIPSTKSDP